jgi:hypothetical protein
MHSALSPASAAAIPSFSSLTGAHKPAAGARRKGGASNGNDNGNGVQPIEDALELKAHLEAKLAATLQAQAEVQAKLNRVVMTTNVVGAELRSMRGTNGTMATGMGIATAAVSVAALPSVAPPPVALPLAAPGGDQSLQS